MDTKQTAEQAAKVRHDRLISEMIADTDTFIDYSVMRNSFPPIQHIADMTAIRFNQAGDLEGIMVRNGEALAAAREVSRRYYCGMFTPTGDDRDRLAILGVRHHLHPEYKPDPRA